VHSLLFGAFLTNLKYVCNGARRRQFHHHFDNNYQLSNRKVETAFDLHQRHIQSIESLSTAILTRILLSSIDFLLWINFVLFFWRKVSYWCQINCATGSINFWLFEFNEILQSLKKSKVECLCGKLYLLKFSFVLLLSVQTMFFMTFGKI
jgi:hypothetical protein